MRRETSFILVTLKFVISCDERKEARTSQDLNYEYDPNLFGGQDVENEMISEFQVSFVQESVDHGAASSEKDCASSHDCLDTISRRLMNNIISQSDSHWNQESRILESHHLDFAALD
jgi:hypothetical protein